MSNENSHRIDDAIKEEAVEHTVPSGTGLRPPAATADVSDAAPVLPAATAALARTGEPGCGR